MNGTARLRLLLTATTAALTCVAGAVPSSAATSASTAVTGALHARAGCDTYPENRPTSRDEALVRAQSWIDERVPYSQSACHRNGYGNYRTDCSGYVSMAWGLRRSYTTSTLEQVSHEIARSDLRPGDALNRPGVHVALFVRWADEARTTPVVREQAGPDGSPTAERTWRASTANAYTPIRYDNIVDTAPGSSLSGDGRADIATVMPNGDVKAWHNGAGFSHMPWDADAVIGLGFTKDNLHFADLDGDGDKEIIAVMPNGDVKAWRNGAGFGPMPWDGDTVIGLGFTSDNLHFADLDGDRKAEIMAVMPNGDVKAWHNGRGFSHMPWDADTVIGLGFAKDNCWLV
ncbi:VCBS repeat-containing protein [Streptosporangium carneum]|uniref:C40 family peptidase n=1 Tax=Streptosporangium carneum TaxID=47481 RepID=UPI0031EBF51B